MQINVIINYGRIILIISIFVRILIILTINISISTSFWKFDVYHFFNK